jgi:phage tail-like protein
MINLGDKLYGKLPNIYQSYDARQTPQHPLMRFMNILGEGGFDTLEKHIIDFSNIYDVDKCPAPLLPLLAEMYGLEFPYNMDEASQRKFIKIIPKLYQYKGTETAFKFLAREIFGEGTVTNTYKNEKPEELTWDEWTDPEGEYADDWKKLFVRLEVDGERLYLKSRQFNFAKFTEIIRPANKIVIPHLALFYADDYNFYGKVNLDDNQNDYIRELMEDIRNSVTSELFFSDKLMLTDEDLYDSLRISDNLDPILLGSGKLNSTSFLISHKGVQDTLYITDEDVRTRIFYDEAGVETITVNPEEETYNPVTELSFGTTITQTRTPSKTATILGSKLVTSFITTNYAPVSMNLSY